MLQSCGRDVWIDSTAKIVNLICNYLRSFDLTCGGTWKSGYPLKDGLPSQYYDSDSIPSERSSMAESLAAEETP